MDLKEFQEKNCRGCRFASKKNVGTGRPCCTFPGRLLTSPDVCLTKLGDGKEKEGRCDQRKKSEIRLRR